MELNEAFIKLNELHLEFGNLINELEKVDNGEDMDYYDDLTQDIHWNNVMLSNRLKKMKHERRYH